MIGVFDSGIGGLSVLEELEKVLPNEDFYYYGDSINNPYGEKNGNSAYTDEQIEKVCELLQDGGFTNKEIAKLTGVSTAMVSMVKIGKVRCQQSEKYKWKTIKNTD